MRITPLTKTCLCALLALALLSANSLAAPKKTDDEVRAKQVKDMKFGMFICWSFSTFSGKEWTTEPHGVEFFKATGCDTDQWARTAKEAGMSYILFLTKHHDGFCLWDTKTTEHKVTNAPLGIDVLAKLKKSCDKYGIKLALYFPEGDWTWDGKKGTKSGPNPEMKKAQLKELCTQYGPIEFYWMDHATNDGGLNHEETVKWVHKFQPDCLVGFNHGTPSGRLSLREMGRPGEIGDASTRRYGKENEAKGTDFLVAEFTYPIQPKHRGGAMWFYSLPKHDNLCHKPEKLYMDYLGAVKFENIFSVDVGPNYEGKLRDIDVKTLQTVGKMIRGEIERPEPPKPALSQGSSASASSTWTVDPGHDPGKATDGNPQTRWGAANDSRSGWLQLDLKSPKMVDRVVVDEGDWGRVQAYTIEAKVGDKWQVLAKGTTLGRRKSITIKPTTAQLFRLNIQKANEVPTICEFELHVKP